MKFLFLLRLWPVYGGGETVTLTLANAMVEKGIDVGIIYFKDNISNEIPYISPQIITHKILNVNCDEFSYDKEKSDLVNNHIASVINKYNYSIVINQWLPICYISKLKDLTQSIIVNCLHTAFYKPVKESRIRIVELIKRVMWPAYTYVKKRKAVNEVKSFLNCVDYYVFLSPQFLKQYEKFSGDYNNPKLKAIPNPLVFNSSIKKSELSNKENVVLFVGRLVEGCKRVSFILKVWKKIEDFGKYKDWSLCIVGDGPDKPLYEQTVMQYGLRRVSFEGFQPPLPYYKRAKIFTMTSSFEGFGMSLVEAHQNGVVPVCLDSYLALHDIVQNNRNGIIVPDNDENAYVAALIQLMESPTLLNYYSQNGIVDCTKFDIDNIVDLWLDLANS